MISSQQSELDNSHAAYRLASDQAMAEEHSPTYDQIAAIGVRLLQEFGQAENDRRLTELRWLMDLRQFRGQYDPEVLAKIGPNRSRAFVRKTRVKVNTVDSRIIDLLFPSNTEKNFTVEPTPKATIAPEQEQAIRAALTKLGGGQAPDPQTLQKAVQDVAAEAAKSMAMTIEDQLVEAGYKDVAAKVIHSGNLYGTGILKAPLVEKKIRTRFVHENGKWVMKSEEYIAPFVDFVPLWRWYPDMAATNLEDCRYAFERHLMSKAAMLKLAERKSFNRQKVLDYVKSNPSGQVRLRYYDTELRIIGERQAINMTQAGQYEVLERWGWMDAADLESVGVKVPQERIHEAFFTNVWLLPNGEVIKAVIQPLNGVTWPYHLYYFDKDETNIFGEGLSAVMRDDQTMLNAAVRMILDNSALTAGPQLEVNMSLLARGERAEEMFPFKIWPRSGTGEDARSPAVRVIEIPNNVAQLQGIAAMFENNADEVTAIPRYLYGDNPQGGAAGTMGGLSMLMGAASIVIKNLISQYDEGVTKKFIQSLYRWNMQFNTDNSIKGDFDVKARGVASLVAKELRAKQLDEFSQLAANPLDAPYIKRDALLRQRAEAHELTDIVKSTEEVEAEMNDPESQMQQQIEKATQQLQLKSMEAQLAKLMADVERIRADAMRVKADAVEKNVGSAYAAMQAGGVVMTNPHIAPIGDEILRSSGWQDATPDDSSSSVAQGLGAQQQPMPPTVNGGQAQIPPMQGPQQGEQVGMNQGMETEAVTDGA